MIDQLPPARCMRVLLIAPSFNILGGQAVQAQRLIHALRDHASVDVTFQPIDSNLGELRRYVQRVKYLRTAVAWVAYLFRLVSASWKFDIIHVYSAAHTSYMLWTLPALVIARVYGRRIVVNYRDGRVEEHLSRSRLARASLRRADLIVCPSPYVSNVFARFGLASVVISNILPVEQFCYRVRDRLRPAFLHNRILEPLYNVPCALRAFQLIQRRYPDASLTVAHDGPLRGSLEQLAAELGLRNTQFVGRIPHADIAATYDSADVYLTSPEVDCMPGSILECFASGLPVVATNVGGIPYIAANGETALLVPPNDASAMAAAAIRLLQEPALVRRLTQNAYQASHRYRREHVAAQWSVVYHRLGSRRHANDAHAIEAADLDHTPTRP